MRVPGILTAILLVPAAFAQSSEVSITAPPPPPVIGRFLAPFHLEKRYVPAAKLTNSPRLEMLVRSGNLYLSVQDVIALVLENNLDIAVQRYSPFLAREVLRRTEGGQLLRGVDTPVAAGPTSVSTAGISTNANGLAGGGGFGGGGGLVTAVGPTPPSLDPYLNFGFQMGHFSTPLTNTLLNQTTALANDFRGFSFGAGKQWSTGTRANFSLSNSWNKVNSPSPLFNPSINGNMDLYITQNILQGRSLAVNNRLIKIAKNNMKVTSLQVELQVSTTVAAVLNLYWDLVSFNEAVRIKERAVEIAQKLYEGNRKQVEIGAMAGIEITRSAAGVSAAKEDLLIAQTNVAQQEIVLKNALSRNGIENTWLDEVRIVPLDHIEVPPSEDIRPVQDLMTEALKSRLEVERGQLNIDSQKLMITGNKNGLLPLLQAFAEFTNHGLSGPANPLYSNCCGAPNQFFLGGNGNVYAQLFRRN